MILKTSDASKYRRKLPLSNLMQFKKEVIEMRNRKGAVPVVVLIIFGLIVGATALGAKKENHTKTLKEIVNPENK